MCRPRQYRPATTRHERYKYNRANIEYTCDLLHDELVRDTHRNHALSVSTIVPAGLRFFLVKQFPASGWRCNCALGSESLSIFRGRCNLAQYCSELTRSTVGFYDIGRIFMIGVFFHSISALMADIVLGCGRGGISLKLAESSGPLL